MIDNRSDLRQTARLTDEKEISHGRTRSRLFPVTGEARIHELVRMLGGGGESARA